MINSERISPLIRHALQSEPCSAVGMLRDLTSEAKKRHAEQRRTPKALRRIPWILRQLEEHARRGKDEAKLRTWFGLDISLSLSEVEELNRLGMMAYHDGWVSWAQRSTTEIGNPDDFEDWDED